MDYFLKWNNTKNYMNPEKWPFNGVVFQKAFVFLCVSFLCVVPFLMSTFRTSTRMGVSMPPKLVRQLEGSFFFPEAKKEHLWNCTELGNNSKKHTFLLGQLVGGLHGAFFWGHECPWRREGVMVKVCTSISMTSMTPLRIWTRRGWGGWEMPGSGVGKAIFIIQVGDGSGGFGWLENSEKSAKVGETTEETWFWALEFYQVKY